MANGESKSTLLNSFTRSCGGFTIRFHRIVRPNDGRALIVAMDHGMAKGPVDGLRDYRNVVRMAIEEGADAALLHVGLARDVTTICAGSPLSLIIKLTNGATLGSDQMLLGSVDQALRYGADAVCVEYFLGSPTERESLVTISRVKRECESFEIPLVVSAYVYRSYAEQFGIGTALHAARVAAELGADIIKTPFSGDSDTFEDLVSTLPVPVVCAGGPPSSREDFLAIMENALSCGAIGAAVGRNIWGVPEPQEALRSLVSVIHPDLALTPAIPDKI